MEPLPQDHLPQLTVKPDTRVISVALRCSVGSTSAESYAASLAQKEKTQRTGASPQMARETSEYGVGT